MKRVLLDENLDWRLIHLLDDSFIGSTVQQMGWGGIDNGELLRRAAAEFDVLANRRQKLAIPAGDQ